VGIVYLGKFGAQFLRYISSFLNKTRRPFVVSQPGITGILVVLTGMCLYGINPYSRRIDFQPPGGVSHYELYERHVAMYAWIRDNTPPQAVFLCPDENLGLKVVMPAGRKLVNPMLLYFNPYVNRGPTTLRQEAILDALDKGDKDALSAEAGDYPMLLLLLDEPVEKEPPFASEVQRIGGSILYEIRACGKKIL